MSINENSGNPDVVLIGAGIMSATLGVLLKQLQPDLTIEIFETLDVAAAGYKQKSSINATTNVITVVHNTNSIFNLISSEIKREFLRFNKNSENIFDIFEIFDLLRLDFCG